MRVAKVWLLKFFPCVQKFDLLVLRATQREQTEAMQDYVQDENDYHEDGDSLNTPTAPNKMRKKEVMKKYVSTVNYEVMYNLMFRSYEDEKRQSAELGKKAQELEAVVNELQVKKTKEKSRQTIDGNCYSSGSRIIQERISADRNRKIFKMYLFHPPPSKQIQNTIFSAESTIWS